MVPGVPVSGVEALNRFPGLDLWRGVLLFPETYRVEANVISM